MKKIFFITTIVITLIMNGGKITSVNELKLHKEIERLKAQGVTVRFIDNETIKLNQDWSGFHRIKSLKEPSEAAIRAWIAADSIPLLEIDPALIDTNRFTGWYTYWTTIPLSNGIGIPPLAGDIDHNGKMEVYGIYKDTLSYDFESHIYEVNPVSGEVQFRYKYIPRRGAAMHFTDVDKNNRQEVVFLYGDSSYFYEQRTGINLPTDPKFNYAKYEYQGTAIFTNEKIIELDKDSLVDFLYRGTLPDSGTWNYQYYTFVAEYNPTTKNFQKVWKTQLQPTPGESGIGGYDVGDYDADSMMNFLASDITGRIWVCENTTNDTYSLTWKDSIPFVNLMYQTSGDVDNDSKREFFVGATMGSGNWTIVYEADSNDHYSPKFAFHLLSGGSLDEPIYMTKDIDGDGKIELIIQSGGLLYVFKSSSDNFYYLHYFSKNYDGVGINFFDFNRDGKLDIITSRIGVNGSGMAYDYADIYRCIKSTDIVEEPPSTIPTEFNLYQNYPNPFNASTMFRFQISEYSTVTLKVFNTLGKEVANVVSMEFSPGIHTIPWDAKELPSGIYYYRCMINNARFGLESKTIKALLIK